MPTHAPLTSRQLKSWIDAMLSDREGPVFKAIVEMQEFVAPDNLPEILSDEQQALLVALHCAALSDVCDHRQYWELRERYRDGSVQLLTGLRDKALAREALESPVLTKEAFESFEGDVRRLVEIRDVTYPEEMVEKTLASAERLIDSVKRASLSRLVGDGHT